MERDDSHIQAMLHQAACLESEAASQKLRPFMLLRPQVYQDGNQWCALYGLSIMEGVVGFGVSPEEASHAFDRAWLDKSNGTAPDPVLTDLRVVAAREALNKLIALVDYHKSSQADKRDQDEFDAAYSIGLEALAGLEVKP